MSLNKVLRYKTTDTYGKFFALKVEKFSLENTSADLHIVLLILLPNKVF